MYSRNSTEEHQDLIRKLSLIDNLESWPSHTMGLEKEDKKHVYESARRSWIKRKISDGGLLLHRDVQEQLIQREYNPLSILKKMIWASLLASYDGTDSKEYFQRIKEKIIKKYGNKWWSDVYNRIKPTYAARQRILKQTNGTDPVLKYAASQSMFIGDIFRESRNDALRMIPKE
ncbi:conserved hypothetical protein [Xenorhabdus bovienii str. oregonense]|uniref:Uncharacterized protein n=1 Tax=Xenorhabdus bovienii str. oregonense TaxID=1398202 RepID=A0A077P089_XENBV|nr:hypothetical protein [Xenorhabdus bovienii]CDH07902.1 conserved hypothetical protein [Xenorhabdus bovienii str. oregonense]